MACSSWTSAGSSPSHQLNTSCISPTFSFKQFFRYTFQGRRKGPCTVPGYLVDQRFEQLVSCIVWAGVWRQKGSNHQTLWGGKERKGTLAKRKFHILRNLTSHLRFILQRDFQDSLVSWIVGNLEGKTPPHAVTVAVLSINGCSSPTLSYGTGISLTMGTAAIFVVCKCADNMSYHTPEGLNSLGP